MRTDNKRNRKAQSNKRKRPGQTKQTKPAAINIAYLDAIIAQHEQQTTGGSHHAENTSQ